MCNFRVFFILVLSGFNLANCQTYSFVYQKPAANLKQYKGFFDVNSLDAIYLGPFLKGKEKIKNFDFTADLQNLINIHKKVVLPPYTLLINDKGIKIPSGARIYFSPGTVIKMKPTAATHFDMLRIYDVEDIEIYNARLIGDRKSHKGTAGEWAAGIGIRNSSRVLIKYADISDTWGDGIFIGSESGGVSKQITIEDVNIDFARRNGLSITSGENIYLKNFLISNTSGTAPMCGVDIEPSLPQEYLININLRNFVTYNNENGGMNINTSVLNDEQPRTVSISIDGHTDINSAIAFSYSINANDLSGRKINGSITYRNVKWINPRRMNYWKTPNNKKIKVRLENVEINSKDQKSILNDQNF